MQYHISSRQYDRSIKLPCVPIVILEIPSAPGIGWYSIHKVALTDYDNPAYIPRHDVEMWRENNSIYMPSSINLLRILITVPVSEFYLLISYRLPPHGSTNYILLALYVYMRKTHLLNGKCDDGYNPLYEPPERAPIFDDSATTSPCVISQSCGTRLNRVGITRVININHESHIASLLWSVWNCRVLAIDQQLSFPANLQGRHVESFNTLCATHHGCTHWTLR